MTPRFKHLVPHLLTLPCRLAQFAALAMLTGGAARSEGLPPRAPLTIAPVIEGLSICMEARRNETMRKGISPQSYCGQFKQDNVAMLRHVLNDLEAGGAAGQVQVGYTLTVQLLSLYARKGDQWVLDTQRVDDYLALVQQIDRPVVLYLAANHFDSQGPLSAELARNPDNLLQLASGKPPATSYFGYAVFPFTLRTDDALPVNRYRFEALRYVAGKIAALPASVQQRIVAVTLAGELHQMFPDFENGMGKFEPMATTDYHPQSVAQFRQWLAQRYGSIATLNQATGFSFSRFDEVPAPGRDIRKDKLQSFAEHYDGFAGGHVPVSGWLWSPQARVARLMLYLDGRYVADIPLGLNRLDVYRVLPEVTTPNVGFRYDLPFDRLPPGRHVGQVVAQVGPQQFQVSSFDLHVMARDQSMPAPGPRATVQRLKNLEQLPGGARASLDLPRQQQDVYFNPLARDWDRFRAEQVRALLARFHAEARQAGITADKLFSHQIVPQVNSTWNQQFFAVDATLGGGAPWRDGMNMYGGAVDSDWLRGFIASRGIRDYGVPEFNPQQWKLPGVHLQAMLAQYRAGARFISPYFLSVTSDRTLRQNAVTSMEIRPDNPAEGSAAFYQAIREFAGR